MKYLTLVVLLASPYLEATEPLVDGVTFGKLTGYIISEKCCGVDLPKPEALYKLMEAENRYNGCSAIRLRRVLTFS